MELVKYNAACKAISDAKNIDEVKNIRDKSEAMRAYAKQAKNKEMEIDAAEIRIRAERRLGDMIRAQKETIGLNKGERGQFKSTGGSDKEPPATLADAGIDKKLSSRAQKISAVPEKEFNGMIKDWRNTIEKENSKVSINLMRAGEKVFKAEKIKINSSFPEKKYMLIYADPPWQYDNTQEFYGQDAERHYTTMTESEISALPIQKLSADDCVLYLWATAPKIDIAISVLKAWGFAYKTCMVWDKIKHNMGFYASIRHEILLIGGKGSAKPDDLKAANQTDSVQSIERGEHSAKPEIFYEIIERLHPLKNKIELFARGKRDGWDAWGNQV